MPTAYWAGGASGAETDTNNAANWVDAANGTNAFGSVPDGNDDVIIQSTSNSNVSHNPTQTAAHTFNSIHIESGGHWTADGSNHLTLNGENGSHFAFGNDGTFTHTNGTVVINNGGGGISHAAIRNGIATSTTGFYDLTISGGGTTCEIYGDTTIHRNMEAGGSTTVLRGALTVTGNLTVGGTLNTRFSSTDRNLTVTGWCDVNGTLTLNDSVVSINALRANSGAAITQGSSGTLELAAGGGSNFAGSGNTEGSSYSLRNVDGTSDINLGGTTTISGGSYFEPRTAPDYASVLNNLVWNTGAYWVGNLTIGGTLIVNASKHLQPYGGSKDIVVTGDVTLNGKLSAYPNGHSDLDNMTFKSLTINNGGEYAATTGTTTITGESGSGVNLSNSGTFTHNQGTVKVTCATQTSLVGFNGTNGFYNYTYAGTGSGQDQVCGGNTDFFGQVIIDSANSEVQMQSHTFNLYGGITIKQGGWDIGSSDTSGTVNVYGSVRNVGGTVVAS